jgi:TonB family protein
MQLKVRFVVLAVCTTILLALSPFSCAQQDQSESKRKMVTRVVPVYPTLAQKMGIWGAVRIEAVVASNGTVKSAGILGGHPVLAQAGVDAVRRCKWEAGPRESKEVVIFNFRPD